MAISQDLVKIDGVAITKLKSFSVNYAKLWKDAERNMNGSVRASLIGLFPKIEFETSDRTPQNQVSALGKALNKPYFSVEFFDPIAKKTKSAQYYAADFSVQLIERAREHYSSIKASLVPVDKA